MCRVAAATPKGSKRAASQIPKEIARRYGRRLPPLAAVHAACGRFAKALESTRDIVSRSRGSKARGSHRKTVSPADADRAGSEIAEHWRVFYCLKSQILLLVDVKSILLGLYAARIAKWRGVHVPSAANWSALYLVDEL